MNYQRDIKSQLIIYRVGLALIFVGSSIIIYLKDYEYLFFFIVAYLIRDFIFQVYSVSIKERVVTIKRILLGGLLANSAVINCNKITVVKNIDAGITTDSEINFEYGIFSSGDGTDVKKLELYKIEYLTSENVENTIKVPLLQEEANIFLQLLQPKISSL